jgi:uncharacterized protein (DUF2062 family)
MTWSRLKKAVYDILHMSDSPHRIALAFATGVFIAFSPFYGLHTASVFAVAWIFRLNVLAVLAGSFINNPWTLFPILASTMWVGLKLMPIGAAPVVDWTHFTFRVLWDQMHPYILPFCLGGVFLGLIGALIAYPLVYIAVQRYRARQQRCTT